MTAVFFLKLRLLEPDPKMTWIWNSRVGFGVTLLRNLGFGVHTFQEFGVWGSHFL